MCLCVFICKEVGRRFWQSKNKHLRTFLLYVKMCLCLSANTKRNTKKECTLHEHNLRVLVIFTAVMFYLPLSSASSCDQDGLSAPALSGFYWITGSKIKSRHVQGLKGQRGVGLGQGNVTVFLIFIGGDTDNNLPPSKQVQTYTETQTHTCISLY